MPVNGVSKTRPILFTMRLSIAEQAQLTAIAAAKTGGDRTAVIRLAIETLYSALPDATARAEATADEVERLHAKETIQQRTAWDRNVDGSVIVKKRAGKKKRRAKPKSSRTAASGRRATRASIKRRAGAGVSRSGRRDGGARATTITKTKRGASRGAARSRSPSAIGRARKRVSRNAPARKTKHNAARSHDKRGKGGKTQRVTRRKQLRHGRRQS